MGNCNEKLLIKTRMHSSRMHTIRCSSLLLAGGVCLPGGVYPGRCLPSLSRGVSTQGGVCLVCPGECLPGGRGVCLVCPGGVWQTPPLPPVDRILDTHFPPLRLRTVKTVLHEFGRATNRTFRNTKLSNS